MSGLGDFNTDSLLHPLEIDSLSSDIILKILEFLDAASLIKILVTLGA